MRRLAVLLLALVAVALAVAAPASAAPALSAIETRSIQAARAYWHGDPACGYPSLLISDDQLPANDEGEAWIGQCKIQMTPEYGTPEAFCIAFAHEWGHLELGATYFAATNPADPAHSADPHSLMSTDAGGYPPGIVPGCDSLEPPPPFYRARHHRRPLVCVRWVRHHHHLEGTIPCSSP